jgi:hypothetical protein
MSVVEAIKSLNLSTDFPSPKIKPEIISRNNEFGGKINFLLCGACFWCASYLSCTRTVTRCPTCDSDNVESLPISNDEVYTFSYNGNRGITLEYSKTVDVLK